MSTELPTLDDAAIEAMFGRSVLLTADASDADLEAVGSVATAFEVLDRAGVRAPLLSHELAYAMFFDQSTRTKSAWAGAAARLGMQPVIVDGSSTQVSHGETAAETGAMLGMNAHALGVRHDLVLGEGHTFMGEVKGGIDDYLAATDDPRGVPVVNLQCDVDHPTQTLADWLWLRERLGDLRGKRIAVSWAYSPSYAKPLSVPQGLLTLLTRFGAHVRLARPPGYDLLASCVQTGVHHADASGGTLQVVDDMDAAFADADVVYPKSWGPLDLMLERVDANRAADSGAMADIERRALERNGLHTDWICDERRMGLTNDALYLHCLPADIGSEVSPGVMAKAKVDVAREANKKLYVIMSLLASGKVRGLAEQLREAGTMTELHGRIAALAERYLPLAVEILAEAVRIPADHVDRPADDGGDPSCGLSNHEGPRLRYLQQAILDCGAVEGPDDVGIDAFGNLVWTVHDPGDGVSPDDRVLVYFDGHTDTVKALRGQWTEKTGGALDAYDGLVDADALDPGFLETQLGYVPPVDERDNLVFGRGTADQLGGVVCQIIATKILLELRPLGSLRGVRVRAHGSVAEEDNDGGGPMYVKGVQWPKGPSHVPDVVILTEGTGDAQKGALGIYRGQRGRMQIEMTVTGRSCHGSMPWEGLNPLEFGGAIVAEAAAQYERREGFLDDPFLGHGTRTASWSQLDTPSDCAVPDRFVVRFDRRLTAGESPEQAVRDLEGLPGVARAREAGLSVDFRVPHYSDRTWKGHLPGNAQIYPGWVTPAEHPAIEVATRVYDRVVGPHVVPGTGGAFRREARVDRWIFSTDGVGFTLPAEASITVPRSKDWVRSEVVQHPAMFGFGPGIEQNTHKIGECVDRRELQHVSAFLATFPSAYAGRSTR